MERPIGFPAALRVLRSWEGKHVRVTISDPRGVELTSITGVLSDQSTADRVEFGIEETDSAAALVLVPLDEPYRCTLGDGRVSVTTAGDTVVLFAYAEQKGAYAA